MAKNTTNHRKDIKELNDRKVFLEDKNRKAAVKKRHNSGKRTARENIQDICDVATFEELGSLLIAAQRAESHLKSYAKKRQLMG